MNKSFSFRDAADPVFLILFAALIGMALLVNAEATPDEYGSGSRYSLSTKRN